MKSLFQKIIQGLKQIRYFIFPQHTKSFFYRATKFITISLLDIFSLGRGLPVKVAGLYPIQVEWERTSMDFVSYEKEFMTELGKELQNSRANFFDIGASYGECSIFAAHLVGPSNVSVFEPNQEAWQHIKKIFSLNQFSKPAAMFPGFVGNEDRGILNFPLESLKDWPAIVKGAPKYESLTQPKSIPIIKLDTFCEKWQTRPNVIKIDVEGAELEVLKGAESALRTIRPIIFLSLHTNLVQDYKTTKEEILQWLEHHQYHCVWLATSHEEHWVCRPKS